MEVKWVSKHLQVDSQDISGSELLFCMANICVARLYRVFQKDLNDLNLVYFTY